MRLRDYFEGWLSPEDLRDANNRQAIYGGSFDTALLELEVLTPPELMAALRAARGIETTPPELLTPGHERPWEEMPDAWLLARDAVPLAVLGGRLWVAVDPDLPEDRLGALRTSLPKAVVTVTASACVQQIADERRGHSNPHDLLLTTTILEALYAAAPPEEVAEVAAPVAAARAEASRRAVDPGDSDVTITIVDDIVEDAPRAGPAVIPSLTRAETSTSDASEFEVAFEDAEPPPREDAAPAVIPRLKRIDSSLYIAAESQPGEVAPTPSIPSGSDPLSASAPAPEAALAPSNTPAPSSSINTTPATVASPVAANPAPLAASPAPLAEPEPERPAPAAAAPTTATVIPSLTTRHEPVGERAISPAVPEDRSTPTPSAVEPEASPRLADPPAAPSDAPAAAAAQAVPAPSPTPQPELILPVIPSLKRPAPAPAEAPPATPEPAPASMSSASPTPAASPPAQAATAPESAPVPATPTVTVPAAVVQAAMAPEADAPVARGRPERSGGYFPSTLLQAKPPSDRHEAAASLDTQLHAALTSGGRREAMIDRLRQLGEPAYSKIAELFPGPLDLPRGDLKNLPQPSAHGPLLRLCIILGEAIAPHILPRLRDPNQNTRFYAALVFQELRSPSCVGLLADLAFDDDRDVRTIAMRVLETYHGAPGHARAVQRIRGELGNPDASRRKQAIQAMGTLRDVLSVTRLIDALDEDDLEVRAAALTSLCAITGQHLGMAPAPWRTWHLARGRMSRGEWMLESLGSQDAAVRRWAAEELVRTTGQRIPFDPRGTEEERAEAVARWRAWITEHATSAPASA